MSIGIGGEIVPSVPISKSDIVLDSIQWIIMQAHEHPLHAGETEFVVGNWLDGYFYARIPIAVENNVVSERQLEIVRFSVSDAYIVDGQSILDIENSVGSGHLRIQFGDGSPSIGWNLSGHSFQITVPYGTNTGFYWSATGASSYIKTSYRLTTGSQDYFLNFGYYANIPDYALDINRGNLLYPANSSIISGFDYSDNRSKAVTNIRSASTDTSTGMDIVYIPLNPTEIYEPSEFMYIIESFVDDYNISNPSETIDKNEILNPWQDDTELETSETGCCCDCTVYVDADGNVTINNGGDTVTNFNVDADATLEANITAAAGAFGAGAIVIDADANVNLQALAGAFGAGAISVDADGNLIVNVAAGGFASGAFGAGAIVNPEINVSGDISGSVSIGATDVNVNVSGGDVSFQQSGTVNNYYYYYDSTEPTDEPFTIDYDEIMSPSEFFDIMDYTNDWTEYPDTIPADTVPFLPAETLPLSVVGVAAPVADVVSQVISDSGLMPLLAPVSVISFYLHFLER